MLAKDITMENLQVGTLKQPFDCIHHNHITINKQPTLHD